MSLATQSIKTLPTTHRAVRIAFLKEPYFPFEQFIRQLVPQFAVTIGNNKENLILSIVDHEAIHKRVWDQQLNKTPQSKWLESVDRLITTTFNPNYKIETFKKVYEEHNDRIDDLLENLNPEDKTKTMDMIIVDCHQDVKFAETLRVSYGFKIYFLKAPMTMRLNNYRLTNKDSDDGFPTVSVFDGIHMVASKVFDIGEIDETIACASIFLDVVAPDVLKDTAEDDYMVLAKV